MGNEDEYEHVPLVATDDTHHALTSVSRTRDQKSWRRHLRLLSWLVALETLNLLFFIGGPATLSRIRQPQAHTLDEYFALTDFNRTWLFDHDNSQEAWDDFYLDNGIISLNTEWIDRHGFPHSAPTPDVPGEMSYQIGVFHSLHCLSTIRKQVLNRKITASEHTLHCLVHLRHNLMCNADVTLAETGDYQIYDIREPHMCRDFNAIRRWAEANRWKEFMTWTLENVYPNDTVETLRLEEELERLPVAED